MHLGRRKVVRNRRFILASTQTHQPIAEQMDLEWLDASHKHLQQTQSAESTDSLRAAAYVDPQVEFEAVYE